MKKISTYCFAAVFLLAYDSQGQSDSVPRPALPATANASAAGPGPPPPPGTPIDGGVLFLLVSGLAFGVNSLRKNKD